MVDKGWVRSRNPSILTQQRCSSNRFGWASCPLLCHLPALTNYVCVWGEGTYMANVNQERKGPE